MTFHPPRDAVLENPADDSQGDTPLLGSGIAWALNLGDMVPPTLVIQG